MGIVVALTPCSQIFPRNAMLAKITGGLSAVLLCLTVIFTIVGLAAPWWTAETMGVTTEISLWKVTVEGHGMSGDEDIDDICKDYRDGCDGYEDTEPCETPLKNCAFIQGNRAVIILALIFAFVAAALKITFAVLLCVGKQDGCSKCPGYGALVLAFICCLIITVLSCISVCAGSSQL